VDDWRNTGFLSVFPVLPITINEVTFSKFLDHCVVYRYKNASGFIRPTNGYNGPTKDGNDYYPLLVVHPSYSEDSRFSPTCQPDANSASSAVIESWNRFIGNESGK